MRRIAILDAPSNLGLRPPTATSVPGCAKAPGALRDQGLLARLGARDAGCVTPPRYDPGDWRPGDGVAHSEQISWYSRRLADRIEAIIDGGEFPVVLGGDCSILLGSALAARRRGDRDGGHIGLVFVDGHSDFRHPGNASYVGAAAGEDLALVTGRGQGDLAAIENRRPYFRDHDVVVLGIRTHDEHRLDLQAAGIAYRAVPQLRAEGAARSAQWARRLLGNCAGFWVHVDVDVLDPAVMPAVDAPDPGGIAYAELELLIAGLVSSPACLGAEITVFDPDYDTSGMYAAEVVGSLVAGLSAVSAGSTRDAPPVPAAAPDPVPAPTPAAASAPAAVPPATVSPAAVPEPAGASPVASAPVSTGPVPGPAGSPSSAGSPDSAGNEASSPVRVPAARTPIASGFDPAPGAATAPAPRVGPATSGGQSVGRDRLTAADRSAADRRAGAERASGGLAAGSEPKPRIPLDRLRASTERSAGAADGPNRDRPDAVGGPGSRPGMSDERPAGGLGSRPGMSDERPVGGLGGRHGDDFTGRQTGERRSGEADGARVDSEGDAGRRADTDPGDAGQRRPGPRPRSSAERFGLSDLDSDRAALARRRGAGGTNPARPDSFRDAANAARGAADLMRGGAGAGRAAGLGRRPVVPPQAEPRSTDRRPPVDDAEVPSDEDDQPFAGLAEQVRAAGSGALGPGTPGRRPDSGLNPAADSGAPGTGARAPEPPPTAETA